MTDNKKHRGKQDRIRIDSKDPAEVEFLHSQYPTLSHQAIYGAIRAAGPMRDDIKAYLKRKYFS